MHGYSLLNLTEIVVQVVVLWQPGAEASEQFDPGPGAEVHVFPSEADMLKAWHALHADFDPDALITFQVCTPFARS